MKAIRFSRFGLASEVAELVDVAEPDAPGRGQVLLELLAAPINPSDLLHFAGRYASPASLPSFAGGGVVGRVVKAGQRVRHLGTGDRVIAVSTERNAWRERLIQSADRLIRLPEGDAVDLALLAANPPTALLMLEKFVKLREADWVIQNAANSSVGISLVQIAKSRGLGTVNVVRREDAAPQLKESGADVVLVDGPCLAARVAQAVGSSRIKLAIDAVAGNATGRLASCVADRGVVVNYGLLSGTPCQVDSADVLFRDVSLRGFWYSRWLSQSRPREVTDVFARLMGMMQAGTLRIPVEAVYPVSRLNEAFAHAERERRSGKVVLRWAD